MQKFVKHRGIVCLMPHSNVDTDQIVPARFLHRPRDEGYGDILFNDLRLAEDGSADPDFPLNNPDFAGATFLVAGENFGCGSSREHAVWALVDAGFRAVIAPSFGDIFHSNALQNGLLVIRLPADQITSLVQEPGSQGQIELSIDLAEQRISGVTGDANFDISAYRKEALLLGLSEMQMTLRHIDDIRAYETHRAMSAPWLQRRPGSGSANNAADIGGVPR